MEQQQLVVDETRPSAFSLSSQDLADICNFDERLAPAQLVLLYEKMGGVENVARLLGSDAKSGLPLQEPGTGNVLTVDQADRVQYYGENIIPPPPSETIIQIILATIAGDPILKVLVRLLLRALLNFTLFPFP